ncbi:hypothetical protein HDU99_009956, partial [Rhizoclosmatium hyalinum]
MIFNSLVLTTSLLAATVLATDPPREESQNGYFGLNPVAPNIQHILNTRTMWEDMNLYLIWYGQWAAADKAIITDFLGGLGNSDFWGIEQKYFQLYDQSSTNPHATPVGVK